MKAIIAILIVIYTIFVFAVGETAQKGMLLAILVLIGAIYFFYKYANFTRMIMKRYDEIKSAVYTADKITDFIASLESQKASFENKPMEPGVEVNRAIGVLKRAKMRAGLSRKEEDSTDDVIRANEDNQQNPPQPSTQTTSMGQKQ